MKSILTILLGACLAGTVAANPIRNSSFELDSANFGVVRFARSGGGYLKPEFDTASAVHDRQSIRFANPNADMIEFLSAEFKLKPGKNYTLSWYMKSDKPVRIRCGVLSGDITPKSDAWITELRWMKPEREWKRYSFSFRAKGYGNYFTEFRWGNWDRIANDATVWFDAFQVDEGSETTEYAPHSGVEAALIAPERICLGEAQMPLEIAAVNYGASVRKIAVKLTQKESLSGTVTPLGEHQLELKPGSVVRRKLQLATGRYGHFRLEGEFSGGESSGSMFPIHYARVFPPRPGKPDLRRESVLGVEFSYGETAENQSFIPGGYRGLESDQESYMRFFRNAGIKLLRSGNNGDAFSWNLIETAPGVFDWNNTDRLVELANRNDMQIMPVLGNMFFLRDNYRTGKRDFTRLPKFVVEKSVKVATRLSWDGLLPPHEMWERYAGAMASRYRGRIAAYELTNEPNICIPGEKYAEYVKIAGRAIRDAAPGTIVVGGGITSDFGGSAGAFLRALGESKALEFCDALSFHPYSSRQENSANPARESLRQLRRMVDKYVAGMPLWNTELYYLWGDKNDTKRIETGTLPRHLTQRFLLDLGEGVKQNMYLPDTSLLMHELSPSWQQVGEFVQTGLVPSMLYPAHSALVHFFAGAVPVARIERIRGITCYLYRDRDGKEIAAFWNNTVDRKFKLTFKSEGISLYDLYGNKLAVRKDQPVGQNPCFLRGSDLHKVLSDARIVPEQAYSITGARQSKVGGKTMLGIGIFNHGTAATTLKVRPDFAGSAKKVTLPPQSESVVYFPFDGTSCQAQVIVSDGKKSRRWPVSFKPVSFCRSGERCVVGELFSFQPEMTAAALKLSIRVNDADRGVREKGAPWNGDTIELFFDTRPESMLDFLGYTPNVHRLFLSPASLNGLPAALQASSGVNTAKISWNITEDAAGYTAELVIPWSCIGLAEPALLGFDIAVDNTDRSGKRNQTVWAGGELNHKDRTYFGTLLKE